MGVGEALMIVGEVNTVAANSPVNAK